MPVYLYRCPQGHQTELWRHVEDANRPAYCGQCSRPADRLFRLRGIGFKGSGFHNTDYRPSQTEDTDR